MNISAAQVAGTAGEVHLEQVTAYLSRLTGEPLLADQPLRLRSIHRAAFSSWARKQQIPLRQDRMNLGALCTVREMLAGGAGIPALRPVEPSEPVPVTNGSQSIPMGAIGIDIEEVENLPLVADYREDPFFQDHFTTAEISYCILQRDPRASFCGIWAAKEAILKAGLIPSSSRQLKDFEIGRDELGRPRFPRCSLSISHTAKTAVAICTLEAVNLSSPAATIPTGDVAEPEPQLETRRRSLWPWSRGK